MSTDLQRSQPLPGGEVLQPGQLRRKLPGDFVLLQRHLHRDLPQQHLLQ
jgi:hypothetical protein